MVMRWDGYGGQLVDQGRDNLGRCGRGAYIIRRALAWSGIRCFDRRWERIAPSRLRRGSSGCCTVVGGGRANGLLGIHFRRVLHESRPYSRLVCRLCHCVWNAAELMISA